MGIQERLPVPGPGLLFSMVAGSWLLLAPVLGHMGKPWPCAVAGAGVLASLCMIWRRPEQRRGWSLLLIAFASAALLVGMGGIPPALLGIAGGVFIIAWGGESPPVE